MRRLLTGFAAVLLVTVMLDAPAQAQQQVQRPQYRTPQPRAFNTRHQDRIARRTTVHTRSGTVRARTVNPRFYSATAASRTAARLKYRTQSRARANLSPARRGNPGFVTPRSTAHVSRQIQRTRTYKKRAQRTQPRHPRPSLWK